MEIALVDGDYAAAEGALRTVTGEEELLQRAVFRLKARRGGFAPLPEVGSRLYTLPGVPRSQRESAARSFVREALAGETGVAAESVTVTESEGTLYIAVRLAGTGGAADVTVEV